MTRLFLLVLVIVARPAGAQTTPRERLDAHDARCTRAPQPADTVAADVHLRRELIAMRAADQADRAFTATLGAGTPPDSLLHRMAAGDTVRTARLREVVAAHGWPTAARVGRDGAEAAFLILQHSPDHVLQALMLPDVTQAAARGEIDGQAVALLTDRARGHAGLPQLYGTQIELVGGRYAPVPIADPDGVDDRRAALCVMPLDLYLLLAEEGFGVRDHGLFDD